MAQAALRQKKVYENELDRIAGTRMTLETQVNAIESANMNLETMTAMRKGADALRNIHGSLNIDKVDGTMDSIREQMDLTNEISDAISNPVGMGHDLDEVSVHVHGHQSVRLLPAHDLLLSLPIQDELKNELEELEQEELNERLVGAESAPSHVPQGVAGPSRHAARTQAAPQQEDDDDAELKALQAELAM